MELKPQRRRRIPVSVAPLLAAVLFGLPGVSASTEIPPLRGSVSTFPLSINHSSIALDLQGNLYVSRGRASATDPNAIDRIRPDGSRETVLKSSTLLPILSREPQYLSVSKLSGAPIVAVGPGGQLYFLGKVELQPGEVPPLFNDYAKTTTLWKQQIDGSNILIYGSNWSDPRVEGSIQIEQFALNPDGSLWVIVGGRCLAGLGQIDHAGIGTSVDAPIRADAAFVVVGPDGDAFATFNGLASVVRYTVDGKIQYLPLIDDRKAATKVQPLACPAALSLPTSPVLLDAPATGPFAPPSYGATLAVDAAGSVFVNAVISGNASLLKLTPDGRRTPIAEPVGEFQEGGSALQAGILWAGPMIIDAEGNLLCGSVIRINGKQESRWIKIWRVAAPGLVAGRPMAGNGDVDRDGTVTLKDALLALRGVLGIAPLSAEAQAVADTNGDGVFNLGDVLRILKRAISAPG